MVRKIQVEQIKKVKKAVPLIESKIKIHFSFGNTYVTIKGPEQNEYITEQIVRAIDFGFDPEDALLLQKEDFLLKFIDIKDHTRRKNLKDVRGRVIGRSGKAKKTIENLTGASLVIKNNNIGLIIDNLHLDTTIQAIETLIHGTKHGTVFSYLERQNKNINTTDQDDLGLKNPKKDIE